MKEREGERTREEGDIRPWSCKGIYHRTVTPNILYIHTRYINIKGKSLGGREGIKLTEEEVPNPLDTHTHAHTYEDSDLGAQN